MIEVPSLFPLAQAPQTQPQTTQYSVWTLYDSGHRVDREVLELTSPLIFSYKDYLCQEHRNAGAVFEMHSGPAAYVHLLSRGHLAVPLPDASKGERTSGRWLWCRVPLQLWQDRSVGRLGPERSPVAD